LGLWSAVNVCHRRRRRACPEISRAAKFDGALRAAPWLSLFDTLFGPIVTLLEWSTKQVLLLFSLIQFRKSTSTTTQDSVAESMQAGEHTITLDALTASHRQYVMNLVNLEGKTLKDIYLPWQHVVHVQLPQPVENIDVLVRTSGHTRIPVVQGVEVTGILNAKEFLALRGAGHDNWTLLIRSAIKLQANTLLLTGLPLPQERRMHMAIIYDRATLLGIVTLEDILEEIVGEIYDEADDGRLKRLLATTPRMIGIQSSRTL
jgi:putative hemolysin